MKKLSLILFCLIYLSSFSQYEQPPGQPCYFEHFIETDEICSVENATVVRDTIEQPASSRNSQFFDSENNLILEFIVDSLAESDELGPLLYFHHGRVIPSDNYDVYNGPRLFSFLYNTISTTDVKNWMEDKVESGAQFKLQTGFGESYLVINKTTNDTSVISIEAISENIGGNQPGDYSIFYGYISDLKPVVCIPPGEDLLYSDSLFYDDKGLLTKRKRDNVQGDFAFDFTSYYKYMPSGEIREFTQIDEETGDTSQYELRTFDETGQLENVLRKTYNFCAQDKLFELTYNNLGQITERLTTTTGGCFNSEGVEKELFYFDQNGNWEKRIEIDKFGDTTDIDDEINYLGDDTYYYRSLSYSYFTDAWDTSFIQTQFRDGHFTEFELTNDLSSISTILFDENGVKEISAVNRFNSFDLLEYSDGYSHTSLTDSVKILSDSVIYEFSNDQIMKRTVYRWNSQDQSYHFNSKNEYYCHGETIGTVGLQSKPEITFELYPNPSSDVIFLNSQEEIKQIEILNVEGSLVKQIKYSGEPLFISDLQKGIYFIKIKTSNGIGSRKVIIE